MGWMEKIWIHIQQIAMDWMENLDTHPANWNGLDGKFGYTSSELE